MHSVPFAFIKHMEHAEHHTSQQYLLLYQLFSQFFNSQCLVQYAGKSSVDSSKYK